MTYADTYHALFAARGLRTVLKARAGYMGSQRWPTTMYSGEGRGGGWRVCGGGGGSTRVRVGGSG